MASVSALETPFSGDVAIDYQKWVQGSLTVNGGSTLTKMSGKAGIHVTNDKAFGPVVLKQGGNANVTFDGAKITDVSGEVNLEYDKWLGGSVKVDEGSKLESINGKAGVAVLKDKAFGELEVLKGGALDVVIAASAPTTFGGSLDWRYQKWVKGNVTVAPSSTFDAVNGKGSAKIVKVKELGGGIKLLTGGNAKVSVEASAVKKFSGKLNVAYEDWVKGSVELKGESDLSSVSGKASVELVKDKAVPGGVTLKKGATAAQADFEASKITKVAGTFGFAWNETLDGTIDAKSGSTLDKISGSAHVGLIKEIPIAGGVVLEKGGHFDANFDGAKVTKLSGTVALRYDDWLKGTITASTGSSLEQVSGQAKLQTTQPKKFGIFEIQQGTSIDVDVKNNKAVNGSAGVVLWAYAPDTIEVKYSTFDSGSSAR